MNEKELRKLFASKKAEFDTLSSQENVDMEELRSKHADLLELKEKIELVSDRSLALPEVVGLPEVKTEKDVRDLGKDEVENSYTKSFFRAFRGKKLSEKDNELIDRVNELRAAPSVSPHLKSSVEEDGGLIVPKSVETKINQYKRQLPYDLTELVSVVQTSVPSGTFVYEKLGTITPFENVDEWGDISEIPAPQFESKTFTLKTYAGILPIPRTLLQDTDQNLEAHLAQYIARKTVATHNKAILDVITSTWGSKTAIENIDAIKDILNVKLDRAFLGTAKVVTNQDGFNFLDKLKDSDGRYLLESDVQDPTKKRILGLEVVVVPNNTLATKTQKAPIFFGDFKEAVRYYDRGVYEVTPTTIGGDAFKRNSMDIRIIDRFGIVLLDKEAVVAGEITIP